MTNNNNKKALLKDRLSEALAMRNMKPIELAEKTNLSRSAISQYLSGYTEPKSDRIFKICQALDVSEAWLMGFDVSIERKSSESSNKSESIQEEKLLCYFNSLDSEAEKERVLVLLKSYVDSYNKLKMNNDAG